MKVYLAGEKPRRQKLFLMCIAPAATLHNQEIPQAWLEHDGKPKQMNVEFEYGEAEVDDQIGAYLLKEGLAQRTKLFLPRSVPQEEFDPALVTG